MIYDTITINARDLRENDVIWAHGGWWDVRYLRQADPTATVQVKLVSRQVTTAVVQCNCHPSEQVKRVLRPDDLVYKVLYGTGTAGKREDDDD